MVTRGYTTPAYEQLKFYQEICSLRTDVFRMIDAYRTRYPKQVGQLTDALRSAKQNVIEGYARDSLGSYIQHLKISRGSLLEARGDLEDFGQDIPDLEDRCRILVQRADHARILLDRYISSLYQLQREGRWKTRWGTPVTSSTRSPRANPVPASTRDAAASPSTRSPKANSVPISNRSQRDPSNRNSSGFTLLEVLIAASIFASIMLIAVASFTKMNQLNDRAREIRAVAEAGRFVMDTVERSVSGANGADARPANSTTSPPTAAVPAQQSVALCTGPTLLAQATGASPATKLVTASSDSAGVTTVRSFYLDATQGNQFVVVENAVTPGSPLAASDVTVSNLAFTGVSAVPGATSQPYVTVDFDVTAVPLRPGLGTVSQHFRTSISSRDYAVATHGAGTLCSF